MFNDKLVILTYKNTIYQSKLQVLAMFVTILVLNNIRCFNRFYACAVHHTEAELP